MRVLELFSGVGGMHRALEQALEGEQGEVVAAMDINTVSNEIYLHNHPGTNLLNRCIEAYKAYRFVIGTQPFSGTLLG